jgi:hypothetical protein
LANSKIFIKTGYFKLLNFVPTVHENSQTNICNARILFTSSLDPQGEGRRDRAF